MTAWHPVLDIGLSSGGIMFTFSAEQAPEIEVSGENQEKMTRFNFQHVYKRR
jgi:hypothetical protein